MLKNLKIIRKKNKLSQRELADAVGIEQQNISSYENEKKMPGYENLIILADFFNTSTDYLLGRTQNDSRIDKITYDELSNMEDRIIRYFREYDDIDKETFARTMEVFSRKAKMTKNK